MIEKFRFHVSVWRLRGSISRQGLVIEKVAFQVSRVLGRMLRAGRYSTVRIIQQDGERQVQKQRSFFAPILISIGGPLVRMLDTGMQVLPQREWEERERLLYQSLYGTPVVIDGDGVLILPTLPGETLATLLEEPELAQPLRKQAIELAVVALVEFHRAGFTHGDAMAENVMVDLEDGIARWFDFETVHNAGRPIAWCRADDLRALLLTSLHRTRRDAFAETLQLILDSYGDEEAIQLLAMSFASAFRRPLSFHLGQAALSFQDFREIDRLLRERLANRDANARPQRSGAHRV